MSTVKQNNLNRGLSGTNTQYHADRSHLSSSMLKLLLKSPEAFYEQWFNPQPQEEKEAFTEGTFTHSLILEPDKVSTQYAIYPGLRRQGKLWEEFKAQHADKTIITAAQMNRCEALFKAYNCMPTAVNLLSGGFSEHTMTGTYLDVPVKARADFINLEKGYIVDVKTTSMPSDSEIFRMTVNEYGYALSAALYAQIALEMHGRAFDFFWVVLSKADGQCHIYKASADTMSAGMAQLSYALIKYKECMRTGNWQNDSTNVLQFSKEDYEIISI